MHINLKLINLKEHSHDIGGVLFSVSRVSSQAHRMKY